MGVHIHRTRGYREAVLLVGVGVPTARCPNVIGGLHKWYGGIKMELLFDN